MFKFNENEVYSAIDAELLQPGDAVAVADTLKVLSETPKVRKLICIRSAAESKRFVDENYESWEYAQLLAKHDDPDLVQKQSAAIEQIESPKFELFDHVRVEGRWEGVITAVQYEEERGWIYCCGATWWKAESLKKIEEN